METNPLKNHRAMMPLLDQEEAGGGTVTRALTMMKMSEGDARGRKQRGVKGQDEITIDLYILLQKTF